MNIQRALTLALLTALATQSGYSASPSVSTNSLHVFGGRGAKQRPGTPGGKLDAALAELTNHLDMVGTQTALMNLHTLNPAAHFMQRASDKTALVLVEAVTKGDPQQLKNALVSLGLQNPSVYSNVVGGWLPVDQIDAATARAEVHSMHASMSHTRAGVITTQGDFAQHSAALRSTYSTLNGTGVTVGAISDSYNCYPVYASNGVPASGYAGYAPNGKLATASTDVSTGDLPSGVNVIKEAPCLSYSPEQLPFGDEGRAMLQIIHDVAPGAGLAFYTAQYNEPDFANGITTLAQSGHANIIVDDVGYFDEPFFQDGIVAQAINTVFAQGVAYFSAAGNDASNAYENTAPSFATHVTTGPNANENLLNFDNSGATTTTTLSLSVPSLQPGWLFALVLQWDQPYVTGASGSPGASSHLNMCVTGSGTDQIINYAGSAASCTGANSTGADPVQILIVTNPANAAAPTAAETITVTIGLADNTVAPGHIKLAVEDNGIGVTINSAYGKNPTMQGHPNAAGAAAVGAAPFYKTPACGTTTLAVLESFSSLGGSPILFDTSGNKLSTPVLRQKPDFVAPDRGNNTFFGGIPAANASTVSQCAYVANYPDFAGTSAAAPHAAAIAALMLQANPSLTPSQIYGALQHTALAMGSPSPDYASGYGFIQADAALAALPPGAPSLSLASTSVAPGATTTLSWTSINTTSCAATGGWSGTQSSTGSTTVTASATAGTATTYTLTCSNANGSASASATLTATSQSGGGSSGGSSSSGGGGGAMDEIVLLMLGALITAKCLWACAPRLSRQSCRAKPVARYQ